MRRLRAGIIGAGRRVREFYTPILEALRDEFEVVGVTSRTPAAARNAAMVLGGVGHEDVARMARELHPDLLVVAVSPESNASVAIEAIETGCAALLETPLGMDAADAALVCLAAARSRAPVGVAEQKPFLPAECLKHQLIERGTLGQIVVVENDYRSYDYHAIAQLRRYLSRDAVPVTAHGVHATFALDPYERADSAGSTSTSGERVEHWELGSVTFDNGALLVHQFTSAYKTAPFRTMRSLRIYGTRGSAVDDEIVVLDAHGRSVRALIDERATRPGLAPAAMTATLPGVNTVEWRNPFVGCDFTEDQVGVALHLRALSAAIREHGKPLYGPHEALRDIEILNALRRSAARNGIPVPVTHQCGDWRCARPAVIDHAVRSKKWIFGPRGHAAFLRLHRRARRGLRRIF